MGGKPCVKGTRVTAGMIVGEIGAGTSIDALLADYPPIWNAPMSCRHCAMRHGACKSARCKQFPMP